MNQIFPKVPKDIRRLLWNTYLNELDRKLVFIAFAPKATFRNLIKLAVTLGNPGILGWILQNGYKLSENDVQRILKRDYLEMFKQVTFRSSHFVWAAKFSAINILKWSSEYFYLDNNVTQLAIQYAIEFQQLESCRFFCNSYSQLMSVCNSSIITSKFRRKLVQSFKVCENFFKLKQEIAIALYDLGIQMTEEDCERARKKWGGKWVAQ